MKRIVTLVLIIAMLLGVTTSFAQKSEEPMVEITDGRASKTYQLYSANLLVGGKDVVSDVPAVLFKDRTLVPIRFVVESLGAEIAWNQKTDEATINTDDKTIVLKIDSAAAHVNGEKVALPDGVPAKLMGYQGNYRTMVPFRFVSEQLGMDVGWINDTRTAVVDYPKQYITGVEFLEDSPIPQLTVKTSGFVEYNTLYLPGSKFGGNDRLVIDIPNAGLNIEDDSVEVKEDAFARYIDSNGILALRGSIFEVSPRSVTRIVIDLEGTKSYNAYFDSEANELKVELLNNVKSVKLDNNLGTDMVVINTDEAPVYNTMDLGNRLVVDILNAQLKDPKSEIPVSRGGISRIRIAPFEPDINYGENDKIVRVVLDLEKGQSAKNLFIENDENNVYIYMNEKPLEGFDYVIENYNQSSLKLSLSEKDDYDIEFDEESRELALRVDKDSIELTDLDLEVKDNILEYIEIDDDKSGKYYDITLTLAQGTVFKDLIDGGKTDTIYISFINKELEKSKYDGKIIVLDAGHGDHDPGAVGSALKVKEKDVALDTTLKLNKLLQDAGFTTVLTREDDTFVDLRERPDLANGINADAFVSVHYNAHPDKNVSGVQVLYAPNDPYRDNKTFARIVQDELLKELKAVDRYIVERPNLVVIKYTKMPAILAEIAFLSNRSDEALANTESYRQRAAQALFNGITRYFDEQVLK